MEGDPALSQVAPPRRRRSRLTSAAAWAASALLVGVLVHKLLKADLGHALMLIRHAGLAVLAVGLPYPIAQGIDTLTGRAILVTLGKKVRLRWLYPIRLASEAVLLSLPLGTAFAESLNLLLLYGVGHVPPTRGIAFSVGRRWLILRAHGVYVLFSAIAGYRLLSAHSADLIHAKGLPLIVLASSLVPFGVAAVMAATLTKGTVARWFGKLIQSIPITAVQSWIRARTEHFIETDAALGQVVDLGRRAIRTYTLLLLAAWMMDSVETWLILRILGVHIGIIEVYAFEAGLSLVRSMAFFVPAGLGVQDLGYLAFFTALGIPDAMVVGAAFLLLKRTKELFWVIVGYCLLLFLRMKMARSGAPPAAPVRA